jgi:hypothetical protein
VKLLHNLCTLESHGVGGSRSRSLFPKCRYVLSFCQHIVTVFWYLHLYVIWLLFARTRLLKDDHIHVFGSLVIYIIEMRQPRHCTTTHMEFCKKLRIRRNCHYLKYCERKYCLFVFPHIYCYRTIQIIFEKLIFASSALTFFIQLLKNSITINSAR